MIAFVHSLDELPVKENQEKRSISFKY